MFSQDTYFDNNRQSQKIVKTRHNILSECMAYHKIIKNSDKNFLSKVTSFIVSSKLKSNSNPFSLDEISTIVVI